MAARGAFDHARFDTLIVDECHYLKNAGAKRTQKIYGPKCDGAGGLVANAVKVIAMSGTPSPNHPGELWPTLRALAPETIRKNGKPMSYWAFVNTYCKTRDNGFGIQIVGGKNLDRLKEAIAPFTLRRRYADVAKDVPPMQCDILPLAGKAPDEGNLSMILRDCKTDEEILAAISRTNPHIASTRHATGMAKVKGMLDWLETFQDCGGGKVVVFAHHREVIEALEHGLLMRAPGSVARLDGSSTAGGRGESVHRFKNDPECGVFIGQLQAAGTAIDLSAASTVVFIESAWVPGENAQAAMRIQSVEKKALCQIYMATLPGSIDERIQAACVRKLRDSTEIFG
jgi:SNF2 family DNA or RNA helicase